MAISTIQNASFGSDSIVNANGIKFPATQVASANANTLDDYEEGTWTPADGSGAGLSFNVTGASYTKIGNIVTAWCELFYPSTANGSNASIAGLPFSASGGNYRGGGFIGYCNNNINTLAYIGAGASVITLYQTSGSGVTNAQMTSKLIQVSVVYQTS